MQAYRPTQNSAHTARAGKQSVALGALWRPIVLDLPCHCVKWLAFTTVVTNCAKIAMSVDNPRRLRLYMANSKRRLMDIVLHSVDPEDDGRFGLYMLTEN